MEGYLKWIAAKGGCDVARIDRVPAFPADRNFGILHLRSPAVQQFPAPLLRPMAPTMSSARILCRRMAVYPQRFGDCVRRLPFGGTLSDLLAQL